MFGNEQVVGQDQIKDFIRKTVAKDKVSHAYILCGEKGTGRSALAMLFAATLQCQKEVDPYDQNSSDRPCGECQSCKQMMSGNQPDVITIHHEKASISVDDIRVQLNHTADIKPYRSEERRVGKEC